MGLAPMSDSGPSTAQRTTPAKPGLTRREALAAAAAAGVGIAAVRVLAASMQRTTATNRPSTTEWVSPLGSESARVMQLLRRATFGYTAAQLEAALSDGFDRTVERLIDTPAAEPAPLPAANTPGGRFPVEALQRWWIDHMLTTPTPFAERMTLFWHGHFTSDYRKTANDTYMYWQNLTWRRMSLSNLPAMLTQVTTDPAMLRYLDLGTSTGANPNENYSRELMELFTMGAGNYTEDDVRAAAKALAGWRVPVPDSFAASPLTGRRLPVYNEQKDGIFDARRAYRGSVQYLGATGIRDTRGVLGRILAQPATAVFVANKVAQHFVTASPDAGYVNRLAGAFRKSRYDVKTLMRSVFTSPEFVDAKSYRTLVKTPTELMVHAARALGDRSMSALIASSGAGMGQTLFDPPDVSGWPNNDSWISSNTVVERVNFVTASLAAHNGSLPSASDAVRQQLDDVLSAQTASLFNQAADDRARWFIVLASPEFQLK